jgi:hypothetical protein
MEEFNVRIYLEYAIHLTLVKKYSKHFRLIKQNKNILMDYYKIPGNESYNECYYTENKEDLYINLFSQEKSGFAFWLIVAGSINECISLVMTLPLIHFFLRDLTWGIYLKFKNNVQSDKSDIPKWFINSHLIFWLVSSCMALFLEKQILQFLTFIGSFAVPFVQLVLPIVLNMELTEGIVYYISFGCLKRKTSKFALKGNKEAVFENYIKIYNLAELKII